MLWYKLYILVFLLSTNVFGYRTKGKLLRGRRTNTTPVPGSTALGNTDSSGGMPFDEDIKTSDEVIKTKESTLKNSPVTDPTSEESTTTHPTTAEPTTEEPISAEPTTEEPTTAEPTTEEPTTEEPISAEPTTEEPTTVEPTTEEPTTEEPTTAEPTTEEPTTEEPTTTEPTTEEPTTEEPTTEEPTTTEAPDICNASLHTRDDLSLIFEFVENKQHIHREIIQSFESEAENIRDKQLGDLENFRLAFLEKPKHLKHILQDISEGRQKLLPHVQEISRLLDEYPEINNQYELKLETLSKILNNFEKTKKLCDLSCNNEYFVERSLILQDNIPYDKNELFCGSIAEVHDAIKDGLLNFSRNQQKSYKIRMDFDNEKYTTEIKELKMKLKDIALQVFGHTMYDILQLQDDYFHFSEFVKSNDIKRIYEEVIYNTAQMKPQIIAFDSAVKHLARYCKSCDNYFVSRQDLIQEKSLDLEDSTIQEEKNILLETIRDKLQVLKNDIDSKYSSIFVDLEKAIEEANSTTAYIDDIRPIQVKIKEETTREIEELEKLEAQISGKNYDGLLALANDVVGVLDTIDKDIQFIEEYVNH